MSSSSPWPLSDHDSSPIVPLKDVEGGGRRRRRGRGSSVPIPWPGGPLKDLCEGETENGLLRCCSPWGPT